MGPLSFSYFLGDKTGTGVSFTKKKAKIIKAISPKFDNNNALLKATSHLLFFSPVEIACVEV